MQTSVSLQEYMSLKDFQFLGKLGQGAYSCVYKARRLIDNQTYAIKKVKLNNLNEHERANALNEVRLLASVRHPNVVSYKESFLEQSTNHLYVVMEFADQGDLFEAVSQHTRNGTKFTQEQIWSILIQLTRGLKALHDLKVMHRDLKSANVFMFSGGAVKVGDLNVSKMTRNLCKTQTGTPYYASPQVWKDLPYDKKSDIWSLGCVIYEAIALKPPFRANDMQGLYKKVTRGFYPRIPSDYSEQLTVVLKSLLEVTPHLRATCDRILELPIVVKHMSALPESLREGPDKSEDHLLQTIKLSLDSKDKLNVLMPRPRYATLDYTERPRRQEEDKDFHNVSLKKELGDNKEKLPRIDDKRREKVYSEVMVRERQSEGIVQRLVQPIRDNEHYRLKGRSQRQRVQINSERRLPVLQGRLKALSPQAIMKILQKQKDKHRVYSIIGKE